VVQYIVEIVTAITIFLVVVILAIYLSILKKNGWIGEPSNYRCPNPECKKIFQSPLKVKDYSTKKVAHLACPECGYDLGSSNNGKALNEIAFETKPKQKTNELSAALVQKSALITNKESEKPEIAKTDSMVIEPNRGKSAQLDSRSLEAYVLESQRILEAKNSTLTPIDNKVTLTQKNKIFDDDSLKVRPNENKKPQEINPEKTAVVKKDKPAGCKHFLGYLWTLSNGATTPDECYVCPDLIECNEETKQ
jgi:hypothetical protein